GRRRQCIGQVLCFKPVGRDPRCCNAKDDFSKKQKGAEDREAVLLQAEVGIIPKAMPFFLRIRFDLDAQSLCVGSATHTSPSGPRWRRRHPRESCTERSV